MGWGIWCGGIAAAFSLAASNFGESSRFTPTPELPTKEIIADPVFRVASSKQMSVAYPLGNGTYDVFLCLTEGQVASAEMRASC